MKFQVAMSPLDGKGVPGDARWTSAKSVEWFSHTLCGGMIPADRTIQES